MKKHWKTYAFWILFSEGVGALSGFLTRAGTRDYAASIIKPPFSPPGWVFPVVWTVLFALMGAAAARVYLTPASNARSRALLLFLAQLGINFLWSPIFFGLGAYGFALLWLLLLWGLVLWTFLSFRRVDRVAGRLLLPYLVWLTFAAYLNAGVWMLNR